MTKSLSGILSRRQMIMASASLCGAAWLSSSAPAAANMRGMKGIRRDYADGPYGLVHFQDTGAVDGNARPLVLCPQAPMSSRQFDSVYPILAARGIRAIGVDTPGFGNSDPTDFVPKVEDWAPAVAAVLDHLGLDQVDVLGHHTGALVATEVALQFPNRVKNLILAGPLPLEDEERQGFLDYVDRAEVNYEYKADGSHLVGSFMGRFNAYGEDADPQRITRYTIEKLMGRGPFWYGHYAAFMYNHNEAIPKITQRTLILTNTGDQIYEHAKWTKRMRPDFEFTELQGGGIDIMDQQPEAWVDAIVDFLDGEA